MIGAKVYECNYTLFLLLPNKIYRRYNQPFTLNDAFNSIMETLKRPLLALAQNEPWKKKPLLIFVYEEEIEQIFFRYLHNNDCSIFVSWSIYYFVILISIFILKIRKWSVYIHDSIIYDNIA